MPAFSLSKLGDFGEVCVRLLRSHACIQQIDVSPPRAVTMVIDGSMTHAVVDGSTEIPVLLGEKERKLFRPLHEDQYFVAKHVNPKIAQGSILLHFRLSVLRRTDISVEV